MGQEEGRLIRGEWKEWCVISLVMEGGSEEIGSSKHLKVIFVAEEGREWI